MNRREFIINALKISGGSFAALYSLGIKPEEVFAFNPTIVCKGQPEVAGGSPCANVEVASNADVSNGGWALSEGADIYPLIDDPRASEDTNTYISQQDNNHQPHVQSFPLSSCILSSATVYVYNEGFITTMTANVEISEDGTNWSASKSINYATGGAAEVSAVFATADLYGGVAWSESSIGYYRITPTSSEFNSMITYNVIVDVNP